VKEKGETLGKGRDKLLRIVEGWGSFDFCQLRIVEGCALPKWPTTCTDPIIPVQPLGLESDNHTMTWAAGSNRCAQHI
jgi:hypothetical protein